MFAATWSLLHDFPFILPPPQHLLHASAQMIQVATVWVLAHGLYRHVCLQREERRREREGDVLHICVCVCLFVHVCERGTQWKLCSGFSSFCKSENVCLCVCSFVCTSCWCESWHVCYVAWRFKPPCGYHARRPRNVPWSKAAATCKPMVVECTGLRVGPHPP